MTDKRAIGGESTMDYEDERHRRQEFSDPNGRKPSMVKVQTVGDDPRSWNNERKIARSRRDKLGFAKLGYKPTKAKSVVIENDHFCPENLGFFNGQKLEEGQTYGIERNGSNTYYSDAPPRNRRSSQLRRETSNSMDHEGERYQPQELSDPNGRRPSMVKVQTVGDEPRSFNNERKIARSRRDKLGFAKLGYKPTKAKSVVIENDHFSPENLDVSNGQRHEEGQTYGIERKRSIKYHSDKSRKRRSSQLCGETSNSMDYEEERYRRQEFSPNERRPSMVKVQTVGDEPRSWNNERNIEMSGQDKLGFAKWDYKPTKAKSAIIENDRVFRESLGFSNGQKHEDRKTYRIERNGSNTYYSDARPRNRRSSQLRREASNSMDHEGERYQPQELSDPNDRRSSMVKFQTVGDEPRSFNNERKIARSRRDKLGFAKLGYKPTKAKSVVIENDHFCPENLGFFNGQKLEEGQTYGIERNGSNTYHSEAPPRNRRSSQLLRETSNSMDHVGERYQPQELSDPNGRRPSMVKVQTVGDEPRSFNNERKISRSRRDKLGFAKLGYKPTKAKSVVIENDHFCPENLGFFNGQKLEEGQTYGIERNGSNTYHSEAPPRNRRSSQLLRETSNSMDHVGERYQPQELSDPNGRRPSMVKVQTVGDEPRSFNNERKIARSRRDKLGFAKLGYKPTKAKSVLIEYDHFSPENLDVSNGQKHEEGQTYGIERKRSIKYHSDAPPCKRRSSQLCGETSNSMDYEEEHYQRQEFSDPNERRPSMGKFQAVGDEPRSSNNDRKIARSRRDKLGFAKLDCKLTKAKSEVIENDHFSPENLDVSNGQKHEEGQTYGIERKRSIKYHSDKSRKRRSSQLCGETSNSMDYEEERYQRQEFSDPNERRPSIVKNQAVGDEPRSSTNERKIARSRRDELGFAKLDYKPTKAKSEEIENDRFSRENLGVSNGKKYEERQTYEIERNCLKSNHSDSSFKPKSSQLRGKTSNSLSESRWMSRVSSGDLASDEVVITNAHADRQRGDTCSKSNKPREPGTSYTRFNVKKLAVADSAGKIPSILPKKQAELYQLIQLQQRKAGNIEDENAKKTRDELKDDWYSSDEEGGENELLATCARKLKALHSEPSKPKSPPSVALPNIRTTDAQGCESAVTSLLSTTRRSPPHGPSPHTSPVLQKQGAQEIPLHLEMEIEKEKMNIERQKVRDELIKILSG